MSLEKSNKNKVEENSSNENLTNKQERSKRAAKEGVMGWLKNHVKSSKILFGSAAILSGSAAFAQNGDVNKQADKEFFGGGKPKIEASTNKPSLKLPDGEIKYFDSKEELEAFMKKSKLIPSNGNVQENNPRGGGVEGPSGNENLGQKRYKYTAPNGKDYRYFDSMTEVENLARAINDKNYKDRVQDLGGSNNKESKKSMENKPVQGFRFYSRDFKLSQKFRSMDELESFAGSKGSPVETQYIAVIYEDGSEQKANEITNSVDELKRIKTSGGGAQINNRPTQGQYPQNIQAPNTVNMTDFMNKVPQGKGEVIQMNNDGSATIYKVTNKKGNLKVKKKKDMGVM